MEMVDGMLAHVAARRIDDEAALAVAAAVQALLHALHQGNVLGLQHLVDVAYGVFLLRSGRRRLHVEFEDVAGLLGSHGLMAEDVLVLTT